MGKNTVTVKVYNETYALKTEAAPEKVVKIAGMVDQKMHRLADLKAVQTSEKIAVWAALDFAAELYELQQKYNSLLEEIRR